MSDAELLRLYAAERAQDAFAELVRRHLNVVYGVALRRTGNNVHLAEDVSQRVFTDLARKASSLASHPSLTGWLYTSTRFAAAQALRSEVRRQHREEKALLMSEDTATSPHDDDWRRLQPRIEDALDDLGQADREAVLLRFYEAKPFAEIGASLQVSEDAARRRVERALDKLRVLLARRGVTSTAAALALALNGNAAVIAPVAFATTVAGSATAGAGVAVGWSLFATMSAAKTTAAVAGAIAFAAVGTAIYQARQAGLTETALIQARADASGLHARLAVLEGDLLREKQGRQAAEDDASRLLSAIRDASVPDNPVTHSALPSRLTASEVDVRYRKAGELTRKGDYAEALREYLWCFDEGMVQVGSFAGVRLSFLLREMEKLGAVYPEAFDALRHRRDDAERRMKADASDINGPLEFAALNQVFKEDHRTLAAFDAMDNADARRRMLGSRVIDLLIASRRYDDVAMVRLPSLMFSQFETNRQRAVDGASSDALRSTASKGHAVRVAVKDIEILAGAGNLDEARELIAKVVALDDSETTRSLLRTHLARAGQAALIPGR